MGKGDIARNYKKRNMAYVKFTEQSSQRYPGDRKWKNEDAPKTDNKKPKGK